MKGNMPAQRENASCASCASWLSVTETSPVTVEVLDLTRCHGRGKLIGLAQVEIVLDGVGIVMQGWRLVRRDDGLTCVEPPLYRHLDGDMVPSIVLPDELEEAVARAVLELAGAFLVVRS